MITIVDYKLGNIGSLCRAFDRAKIEYKISSEKDILNKSDVIVLPGVGAFRDAIEFLEKNDLKKTIIDHANSGKYLVGICLGMQLFYEKSYENGDYEGLALLKGEIKKLESIKVPHMGWNNLEFLRDDYLVKGLGKDDYVYFVHSYYGEGEKKDIVAYSKYGNDIPAIVRKKNIIGFQFHPEKSGEVGEIILKNLREVLK